MKALLNDDHAGVEKPAEIFIETVQADGGVNVFSASPTPAPARLAASLVSDIEPSVIPWKQPIYAQIISLFLTLRASFVGLDNVYHIPAPYMFPELDTIKFMQTLLDDDHSGVEKPAAIFIETVQADGGVNVFSVEYLKALREFCDKNDILMVVDDVQVGCARTGTFFSFERAWNQA